MGCGAHCVSRRSFLKTCGGALATAGAAGLVAARSAHAAQPEAAAAKRPRIGVVFICYPPEKPVWPYVAFDYATRRAQIMEKLAPGCPDLELVPLVVEGSAEEEVPRVASLAAEVDGLAIIALCTHWGLAASLLPAVAKLQMPTVFADDPYSGSGIFLCRYAEVHRAGSKIVGVSSCRFQDVVDVMNAFKLLASPGTTLEAFAAEAERVKRANFAAAGDLACLDDPVQVADVGDALKQLQSAKILLVGGRAGQPFTSLGSQVQPIGFDEINAAYNQADKDEAAEWTKRWAGEAQEIVEPSMEDIEKSAAIYLAMKRLLDKHAAQAITINCLGGFYGGYMPGYPCLGYRQLNNDAATVSTCEAQLPDMTAQLMCKYLLGRVGFASDPVLDTSTNQIIYAHCVAPNKMFGPDGPANPFRIRSHAEDGKGAAIQSLLPPGYMTTSFRINPGLKEMVIHQAKTVGNVDEPRACRTKLAAEVKGDIGRLFNEWDKFSWHRLTVYGDVREPIEALAKAMDLKIIRET
jgi:L-fucose isomerase-like protein